MPRTNQTKDLLAESLQELMIATPLEKISVNDIVDHAGVGRNTFYYHFEDKYDLVNWYFQTGIMRFLVAKAEYGSWQSLLSGIEEYFREHHVFYNNALRYKGQNCLQDYMYQFLLAVFKQRLSELRPTMNADDLSFSGNFLTGALLGILLSWVENGMKDDVSTHYACLRELFRGDLLQLLLDSNPELSTMPSD